MKTFDLNICYEILITLWDIDDFFARFIHLIHLNMKGEIPLARLRSILTLQRWLHDKYSNGSQGMI